MLDKNPPKYQSQIVAPDATAPYSDRLISIGDAARRLSRELLLLADTSVVHLGKHTISPSSMPLDDLLRPKQVAGLLSVSMSLLEKWRRDGGKLPWIRLEGQRSIRYRRIDVLKFISERGN